MKLFSRYVFILLAVFFASPLAGKSAQRYLKHQLIKKETTASRENDKSSEKVFFCEQEENPENNLNELEEDETLSKFFLSSLTDLSLYLSKKICSASHSFVVANSGKLFLLFHSLKLYC